jgi:outer membrane protein assembly factor BamB
VLKNADTFEVLATNKLDDVFDATPAIVGDELYLRGSRNLYCIARQ